MRGEALVSQMRAAVAAQKRGDFAQAIAAYRLVLRSDPNIAEAHNNLAVALKGSGQLGQAETSFLKALSLRPDYPAAHANIASTLLLTGKGQQALRHLLHAMRLEPRNTNHVHLFAEALRSQRFSTASPEVLRAIERCFETPDLEHQLISAATLSLVRRDTTVATAFEIQDTNGHSGLLQALRSGRLNGLFKLKLLHRVLSQTIVADREFEALLTGLRRGLLDLKSDDSADESRLPLVIALAQQCFLTGYAYAESPEEAATLASFRRRLSEGQADIGLLAHFGLYRPLQDLPAAKTLAADAMDLSEDAKALLRRQIAEPLCEQKIAMKLPKLTPIGDMVSQVVQAQYEQNPYPRWHSIRRRRPRPLPQIAAELLPGLQVPPPARYPTRILVAGCGTGRHALAVATRYSDAEVLAIDLSRVSLAFAQRKANEAGLDHIRFAQGDILALGALGRQFDLIECVGVLHHLDDPLAGWRVLVDLLADQGLMKIGLYSRLARRHFEAARNWLQDAGYSGDTEGLRAARQALLALDPTLPAAQATRELDFYSLSGCRDLLFNEQETSYDLKEVSALLQQLDLRFLGFEFVDGSTPAAYRRRHPAEGDLTDLAKWDQFEAEAPDSFHNMYQFWCQRRQ